MAASDGAEAWEGLRRNPEYRAARSAHAAAPVFEDAPFPIRIQGAADREAARFALLAWQDPDGEVAASPFWSVAPMHCAELVAGSRPLLALVAAAGARIEGLRLAGGALVLKIERGRLAAQVRVGPGGAICEDAGLSLRLDCALPLAMALERVTELWGVVHDPAPRRGRDRGEAIATC